MPKWGTIAPGTALHLVFQTSKSGPNQKWTWLFLHWNSKHRIYEEDLAHFYEIKYRHWIWNKIYWKDPFAHKTIKQSPQSTTEESPNLGKVKGTRKSSVVPLTEEQVHPRISDMAFASWRGRLCVAVEMECCKAKMSAGGRPSAEADDRGETSLVVAEMEE
jgi:hypothetical protein